MIKHKIILILACFLFSGCGGMKGYIIADDIFVDGKYNKKSNFIPKQKPQVYFNINRPAIIKTKIKNMDVEIDGRNKNNVDKFVETAQGMLPLMALKKA